MHATFNHPNYLNNPESALLQRILFNKQYNIFSVLFATQIASALLITVLNFSKGIEIFIYNEDMQPQPSNLSYSTALLKQSCST